MAPLETKIPESGNKKKEKPILVERADLKADSIRSLENAKSKHKIHSEKRQFIENSYDILKNDERFKDILLDRKLEDLKIADFYLLEKNGADLSALFLTKSPVANVEEYGVNLGGLTNIEGSIQANIVLPKEIKEVEINGVNYKRTNEGFFNPKAEDPYLLLKSGTRIKVIKKELAIDTEELKKNEERYRNLRTQEIQESILESAKSSKQKVDLPTHNKEDIAIALSAFGMLFGFIFNQFGLDSIFKQDSNTIDISGKVGKAIVKHEKEIDEKKQVPFNRIFSSGIRRSPSGTTLCSQTAREDAARLFGLVLPRGNAVDVQNSYKDKGKKSIEPSGDNNVADIFTGSKSVYGHRLLGFKKQNEWYVIDPYPTGGNNTPMKLDDYNKNVCERMGRPIKKVVLYKSEKTVV